jgi:hypothetical protein
VCCDGRRKWCVGDEVVVGEAFAVHSWGDEKKELAKDTEGTVLEFNAEGAAMIAFREPVSLHWVPEDQFYRLFPLPNARDTPFVERGGRDGFYGAQAHRNFPMLKPPLSLTLSLSLFRPSWSFRGRP